MAEVTSKSTEWIARADQVIMKTYGRYPIVPVRGEGCRLWDADGKEYLDFLAGVAVNNLGHCHPKVVAGHAGAGGDADPLLQLLPDPASRSNWPNCSATTPLPTRPSSATAAPRPTRRPSSWPASTAARPTARSATRSSPPPSRSTAGPWPRSRPPARRRYSASSTRCCTVSSMCRSTTPRPSRQR